MLIEREKATHTNTRSGAWTVDYYDKTKLWHQFPVEGHPRNWSLRTLSTSLSPCQRISEPAFGILDISDVSTK